MARVIVTSSAYSRSEPTGNAHRDPRHANAERLEQPREVERRRFAFDRRVGRENHFVDAAVADARQQPLIFRSSGPTPCSGDSAPIST